MRTRMSGGVGRAVSNDRPYPISHLIRGGGPQSSRYFEYLELGHVWATSTFSVVPSAIQKVPPIPVERRR